MLINIHESLVDKLDNIEIIDALEMLGLAAREGKHKIIANRKTLENIYKCPELAKRTQDVYRKMFNDSSEYRANIEAVSRYIEVIEPCSEPKLEKCGDKQIIKVPAKFFNNTSSIQPTILLCENLPDTQVYERIAKVYCVEKKIGKVPLHFEEQIGGGSTIANVYENIQKKKTRLCLCIADSDKLAPDSSLGTTAKLINDIDANSYVITQLTILKVREIENLIPNSILSELCSNNLQRSEALKIIESISNSQVSEIRGFLDIKEGSCLYTIIESKEGKVRNFWDPKLTEIARLSKHIRKECLTTGSCPAKKKEQCKCYISLGFGTNILENMIDWMQDKNDHTIAKTVDSSLKIEWEHLGENIFSWGFSCSPIRA